MNIKSSRLLTAAMAMAMTVMCGHAAVVPSSITPPDNSTVEKIDKTIGIELLYDFEVYYASSYIAPTIEVTNANGTKVCNATVNYTSALTGKETMTIKPSKDITDDGTYFFTIPQGTILNTETNEVNDLMVLTYKVGEVSGPGGDDDATLEYNFEFDRIASTFPTNPYDFNTKGAIKNIFIYWKEKPSINLNVKPYLEDASGNRTISTKATEPSSTGTTNYHFIYFDENETKLLKTGDYTLVIPEGFAGTAEWKASGFTKGSCNAEVRKTFSYIQDKELVVAEPKEVEFTKLGWYDGDTCVLDYLEKPETSPNIKGSDTMRILIASDKNLISNDVKVDIYDETTEEWMWGTNTFYQQVSSETDIRTINGKNADGEYEIEFSNPNFTLEFLQGHEYSFRVAFYQKYDGVREDALVCYGSAEVRFGGTTPVFQYSDAEIVSVTPAEGSEFIDANDAKVTITFTKPVTMGNYMMDVFKLCGYTSITSNEDGTVWTLKADPNGISGATGTADFRFSAKDTDGRPVRSEKYYTSGEKDKTYITISYYSYLGGGTIESDPADGSEVESLYAFKFTAPYADHQNIGFLGINAQGKITEGQLKDAKGNVVAILDREDVTANTSGEYNLTCKMHLDKTVTAPGNYTLYLPGAYFMTGTEALSVSSKPTILSFVIPGEVVEPSDYATVKLSIGGNAGIIHKASKTRDLVIAIEGSDLWTLDTLSLDSEDVTADVTNGIYTIPAADLKDDITLTAEYKFAKTIDYDFTSGIAEITGCPYTVSIDEEILSVNNLQTGDVIRVFTINGMEIADKTATDKCLSVSLATGEYIILINDISLKVSK